MKKQSKKYEEKVIKEVVNSYKTILCKFIKTGKNLHQTGMLFDPTSTYQKFWIDSSKDFLTIEEREVYRINFSLSALSNREAEIIWNEFFFPTDKFYWMAKYNRSTYYRIRSKAIENFYNMIK